MKIGRFFGFAFEDNHLVAGELKPRAEIRPADGAGKGAGERAERAGHPARDRLGGGACQRAIEHDELVFLSEGVGAGGYFVVEIADAIAPAPDEIGGYLLGDGLRAYLTAGKIYPEDFAGGQCHISSSYDDFIHLKRYKQYGLYRRHAPS